MDPKDPSLDPSAQLNPATQGTKLDELEQSLLEAEELLSHVKARFAQVRSAQDRQIQLQDRLTELNTAESNPVDASPEADLSAELETIKNQLAATWEELESQLITWRDREELFWQFLRFSGIGFGLALFLNFLSKH